MVLTSHIEVEVFFFSMLSVLFYVLESTLSIVGPFTEVKDKVALAQVPKFDPCGHINPSHDHQRQEPDHSYAQIWHSSPCKEVKLVDRKNLLDIPPNSHGQYSQRVDDD